MYLAATLIRLKRALKNSSTSPFASPLSWKISWPARDLEARKLPLRSVEGHVVRKIRFSRMSPDLLLQDVPSRRGHASIGPLRLAFRKDENDY